MNAPVATLYFISVGVFALGSFQAAVTARSSAYGKACWAFSALCLFFALFQLACGAQYSATSFQAALSAHKWVNFFSVLLIPLIWYLVACLELKPSSFRASYVVGALSSIVLLDNYLSPFGFRFEQMYPDALTMLPWGEQIWVLSGERTLAFRITRLLALGLIIYTMFFSFRITRLGEKSTSRLIWLALSLMLVAGVLAGFSDSGELKIPYLGGFSFLVLAISFSALVGKDVSNRRIEELELYSELQHEIEGRKIANQRIEHVLNNDVLTGLPNRAGALIGLRDLLELNRANQSKLGVFIFDVDQLSIINGTRGYKVGDQLLIEVSQRIRDNVRDSDLIARLGSGRFVVGATGLKTERCVTLVYEKVSGALASPFFIEDSLLSITSNTGVAVFPDNLGADEDILAAAELALHNAKSCGTGKLRFFHPSLKENIQQRIDFESALKEALGKKQFFLCYQPQVLASNGKTVCLEALIRWQHPVYGLVMPDRFIQLAETMGIIANIGAWVIDQACEKLAHWRAMGFAELRVAINLSAQQLLVSDLEETVSASLQRHHLSGSDIELEITESVLMQDPERSIERLGALRQLGVRLSIDDFGTGYSSLAYLRVLPVQAFKLDRGFVWDMGKGGKGWEICATAIGLAQNLGLEVVAEGVETEEQCQQLQKLGCHLLQGYLFAKPLTADAVQRFLELSLHGRAAPCTSASEVATMPNLLTS
nr:bifunctional diguanylate cyclase/phosphodiesterase [uncultured Undibacterium sp.]